VGIPFLLEGYFFIKEVMSGQYNLDIV